MTLEDIVIAGRREKLARLTAGEALRCACCGKRAGVTGPETPCVSCGFTPMESGMIPDTRHTDPRLAVFLVDDGMLEVFTGGRGSP